MLRIRRLGLVTYAEAYALQRALAWHATDDYLLLLEHPHVYTMGVRTDPAHVLVDPSTVGADLVRTDRGGDVTYHGPGQLVAYPIVTIPGGPDAGPNHVRQIEQLVIDALRDVGLASGASNQADGGTGGEVHEVGRLEAYPGVWLGPSGPRPRKIAAIGVRTVRTGPGRRRTLHGVALNVSCDLSMFGHIVPCGIADRPVTSLAAEGIDIEMSQVIDAVVTRATAVWGNAERIDRQDVSPVLTSTRRTATASGTESGARSTVRVSFGTGTGPIARSNGDEGELDERAPVRRLRAAGVDPAAGLSIGTRKPAWLRVPARMGSEYLGLARTVRDLGLVTVCEEAGCPNIYECWADGTATFMVNGSRCTRACGFCLVDTRHPLPLDPEEPERVAQAVERLQLAHAVVTCVARDDLPDGGAGAIAATVEAIRRRNPGTAVEVLISDCKGDAPSQSSIFAVRPDVLNHNIETVARLQRAVRPSAGYARSLALLGRAAESGLVVKSGLMVGLGETEDEVIGALADLASVGVAIATVGQYIRPSRAHLPVARWWAPDELQELGRTGLRLGLRHVEASPLTRSSYHARGAAAAAGLTKSGPEVLRSPG